MRRVMLTTLKPDGFGVLTTPDAPDYDGVVPSGTIGSLEGPWPGMLGSDGWNLVRLDDGRCVPAKASSYRVLGATPS